MKKSDVFSFGVVLLEIVSGKLHILDDLESTSIIQWVQQHLASGNIESVVDTRMHGNHDINSVWKAADIALKCTSQTPEQRPMMTDVVAQLQECLDLEVSRCDANAAFYTAESGGNQNGCTGYGIDVSTGVSQSSTTFEMEHLGRVTTMSCGPAAR